jgi:NAD(P)-dependent dehydrogenase (short-subunit alcohol dehydrogenase family)
MADPSSRVTRREPSAPPAKRIAFVTGGTGALGAAVARAFVEAGYETHVTASREADAQGWKGPGRAHAVNLADLGAVRALAAGFAEIHALALCAGAFAPARIAELGEDDLDKMMVANFKTASHALAAFGPKMRAEAAAVVVGSQSYAGAAGMAPYAASKAAVVSFARSAAAEWKDARVRVNAVLPDTIDTPANRRAMPSADFTRWATPEEIADVIVWLCSPAARVVSGNAIAVGR